MKERNRGRLARIRAVCAVAVAAALGLSLAWATMGGAATARSATDTTTDTSSTTTSASSAPANDDFAGRQQLSGGSGSVDGTNAGATAEDGEPDHACASAGSSVWYEWTAGSAAPVTFSTGGSDFDTVLAVYTAPEGLEEGVAGLQPVVASDQAGDGGDSCSPVGFAVQSFAPATGDQSELSFRPDEGTTYYLAVDGRSGTDVPTGSIALSWLTTLDDDFADATTISATSGADRANTSLATREDGEPQHGDVEGGHSLWWRWTAPADGLMHLDTGAIGFPSALAVYTGSSVGELTRVANDTGNGAGDAAGLAFRAVAGTTYRIAVDGNAPSGSAGDVELEWSFAADEPSSPAPTTPAASLPTPPSEAVAQLELTQGASPSLVVEGTATTFTLVVTNRGSATATEVSVTETLGAGLVYRSASARCSGTGPVVCTLGDVLAGDSVSVSVTATTVATGSLTASASLTPGDVRAEAAVSAAIQPPAQLPLVPPAPPILPPPVRGTLVNAQPVTGTVLVDGQPFLGPAQLHVGAVVDVRSGSIELLTGSDSAVFSGGVFRIEQAPTPGLTTDLVLVGGDFSVCDTRTTTSRRATQSLAAKGGATVIRRLRAAGTGHFRTQARYSSATVRGTVWITEDRCDGSLTTVERGLVAVVDQTLGQTVYVPAGYHYLAPA